MTRLLYLPDDATVIQLEVELTPSQLATAINTGMRPVPVLKNAHPGKLTAIQAGTTVIVTPWNEEFNSTEKPDLSKRQAQILELSLRGLSSGEIALLLHLSVRTVNYHLGKVKERLRREDFPTTS